MRGRSSVQSAPASASQRRGGLSAGMRLCGGLGGDSEVQWGSSERESPWRGSDFHAVTVLNDQALGLRVVVSLPGPAVI